MAMKLTERDYSRLREVHGDLQRVIGRAELLTQEGHVTALPFTVLEGKRSLARQKEMVAKGASQTMNSRHLTGHAVDLAPLDHGKITWAWPLYYKLAELIRAASVIEEVPIRWGGTWGLLSAIEGPITRAAIKTSFPDGPHFELPVKWYP